MPLYEYHCPDCGKDCELLVRSSSETPVCPHCGSQKLEKQFSTFAPGGSPAPSSHGCGHHGGCGCAHGGGHSHGGGCCMDN